MSHGHGTDSFQHEKPTTKSHPPIKVEKEEGMSPKRKGRRYPKVAAVPKSPFEGSFPELKRHTFDLPK